MAKKQEQAKSVKVTLVRSPIGYEKSQGATVRSLGLKKLHSSVVVPDNDAIRGMLHKVRHLVVVEES